MRSKISLILGGIVAFIFLCFLLSTCTLVHPTEAGFKINKAGDYRGVSNLPLVTGYNFYLPWITEIKTIPTTMQHIVWSEGDDEGSGKNQHITIACMGGAGFKVDVGLNYHVNANDAPRIYLKWKETDLTDISSKFIRNITRGAMQDVSGHITVDSILNNLPAYESSVRTLLTERMATFGFIVDNFNVLKRPVPTDNDLNTSINNKIKARQDAETAVMQLQTNIAEANKEVAKARGDSASKVIIAAGEAEAIRLKQKEITPTYVEYIKWSTADKEVPRVPQYVGAGGFGFPINAK